MSFVNLVSGGLDSSLVGLLAHGEATVHFPLFIDYGQRAAAREWATCQAVHQRFGLPLPTRMDLSGFGQVIVSGLTNKTLDVRNEAFTPGRNLMFLLMGAAYAYQCGASAVAIGLLAEEFSLFPDQRGPFLHEAENAIGAAMGRRIKILTPLIDFGKADVVRLATERGLSGTYSCHTGEEQPCGECIACLEFQFKKGG
jgi:7-cyano-7-deazaguanine synthase